MSKSDTGDTMRSGQKAIPTVKRKAVKELTRKTTISQKKNPGAPAKKNDKTISKKGKTKAQSPSPPNSDVEVKFVICY